MNDFFNGYENDEVASEKMAKGGSIKISPDVISTIAGIAAEEIEGVGGMYSSFPDTIAEKIGAKSPQSKGVRIEITDEGVAADVYITIKYGYKLYDISEQVQQNVKNNIETMTGMNVLCVNVHIENILFEKKPADAETPKIEQ